jgi:hypothetical protein
MFNRFFQGHQDSLIESGYDVSQKDIDWVVDNKVDLELRHIAYLLAFEELRPVFLLWQIGERREHIKVKTLSQNRSMMISPNEV